jgi:hypothetical protein
MISIFLSSIEKDTVNLCNPVTYYKLAKKREWFKSELWDGPGGSGKTYTNLFLDTGLIDICYVAPSWKLASRMAKDYKEKTGFTLPVQVHHNFLKMPYCEMNLKKYGVIIWDECSMTTEHEKNLLLENSNSKIIFCGDIGHQLPPVINRKDEFFENKYEERKQLREDGKTDSKEYKKVCSYLTQMDKTGIENIIECRKNYRFKCNELKKVIAIVRNNINRKIDYRKLNIQEVSRNDDYDYKNDIILVSRHEYNEEYKIMYAELPKYKSISNSFGFKNGEILFTKEKGTEFRHGFTVHSVQGETFEGKNQMFYTAISRARYLNQIYLITEEKPKKEVINEKPIIENKEKLTEKDVLNNKPIIEKESCNIWNNGGGKYLKPRLIKKKERVSPSKQKEENDQQKLFEYFDSTNESKKNSVKENVKTIEYVTDKLWQESIKELKENDDFSVLEQIYSEKCKALC